MAFLHSLESLPPCNTAFEPSLYSSKPEQCSMVSALDGINWSRCGYGPFRRTLLLVPDWSLLYQTQILSKSWMPSDKRHHFATT